MMESKPHFFFLKLWSQALTGFTGGNQDRTCILSLYHTPAQRNGRRNICDVRRVRRVLELSNCRSTPRWSLVLLRSSRWRPCDHTLHSLLSGLFPCSLLSNSFYALEAYGSFSQEVKVMRKACILAGNGT